MADDIDPSTGAGQGQARDAESAAATEEGTSTEIAPGDIGSGDSAPGDSAPGDVGAGDVGAGDVGAGDIEMGGIAAADKEAGDIDAADMDAAEITADEEAQIAKLLADLADDPDAPQTTVSGLSVIAAARSAAKGVEAGLVASTVVPLRPAAVAALPHDGAVEVPSDGAVEVPPDGAVEQLPSVGERHVLAVRADATRRHRSRRRTGLIALVAAASLVGIAAVVIPLSTGSSSTSTSANAARDSAAAAAEANPQSAADLAAQAPADESAAAEAGSAAAAAGADTAGESSAAGSERPAPGPDALTETVPADGGQPIDAATTPAGPTCWPALSKATADALTAALPAGAFGDPTELAADCGDDPLGGALLAGTAPGTVLVVRVSKAEQGACARGSGEAGVRCTPRGDGLYVSVEAGGQSTAFTYGNGNEVAVGGWPATGDSVPIGSGLTDDQLIAAGQAVLGALG